VAAKSNVEYWENNLEVSLVWAFFLFSKFFNLFSIFRASEFQYL